MFTATLAEVQKKFGFYRARAHAEPVLLTSHGENDLVMLSYAEYTKLKQRSREVVRSADLSADDISLIEAAIAPVESHEFDHEDRS